MPYSPDNADLHYDSQLADFSVANFQDRSNFVFHQVFPFKNVTKKSGVYAQYNKGDLNRNEVEERAPMTEAPIGGYGITRPSYTCKTYHLGRLIDDEDEANADEPLDDVMQDAAMYLMNQMMINAESQFVTAFMAASVWTTERAGVAASPSDPEFLQWDVATANPVTQIGVDRKTVLSLTGKLPNVLVCGYNSWIALRDNDEVQDLYKHTSPGILTPQLVAQALELDKIVVAQSIENTANSGATDSFSMMVGENTALLAYVDPNPSRYNATAGVTFRWTGLDGANADGVVVRTWREEKKSSDAIDMKMSFVQKVVSADCGVYYTATNTL